MKAGGFSRQVQQFNTFFGLKLCQLIFISTEQLSRVLQCKDTTVQEAKQVAITTATHLQKQRTDKAFDQFYTPSSKELFSEVHHLLQLYLTVPVTTATSERTFSP